MVRRASNYIEGKIHELRVAGELLNRGFDVYLPVVDSGVDIIAVDRESKELIFAQVKKAKYKPRYKRWDFRNIPKKLIDELEKVGKGHKAFFIFVLERPDKNYSYLILSPEIIKKFSETIYPMENPGRGKSLALIIKDRGDGTVFVRFRGKEEKGFHVKLDDWEKLQT